MCGLKTLSHVVVGTPSHVSVLIANKSLHTKYIKIFVLDKAYELLAHKNKNEVRNMLNFLEEDILLLFFKAMDKSVLDASTYFVRNPIKNFEPKKKIDKCIEKT